MHALQVALRLLPEELRPQLSNCLSTLNTFCSSLEAHCNQAVQPLWKAATDCRSPPSTTAQTADEPGQGPGFYMLQHLP